ncbi:MAG: DNA polymerase III subunit delta' [Bacteroidota bacterium]|jgi:DNA polymerase-3 subunit delta'
MSWSSIIGQERVKALLKRTLQSGQVAHAYLFYGPEGIGKDALAIEFAKTLNCTEGGVEACGVCSNCQRMDSFQHPNIKLVFALPVGKNEKNGDDPINVLTEAQVAEVREQIQAKAKDRYKRIEVTKANFIKINSVRDIKREAAMSRIEDGKKIFIIFNADMMNTEASNSLLKTLEEPLPGTILLLTTSAKDQLLPTIVSRCQLIKCDLLSDAEIETALVARNGVDENIARLAAQLANGSYSNAQRFNLQDMAEERKEVVEFMRLVLGKRKTALIDAIDELASSTDRPSIERWLKLLQSWLRDALLIQQKAHAPLLEDEEQSMENFVKNFQQANLIAAIQSVEKAIAHLDKNVYLHLILTMLAIDLRKNITEVPLA